MDKANGRKASGMTLNIARDKMFKISKDFEKLTKELGSITAFLEERGNQIENQQDVEIMKAAIESFKNLSQSVEAASAWISFLDQYGPTSD